MLNRAGPISARGRDTTMFREILDQTAEHLGKDIPIQPAIEADVRDLIGKLYEQLKELKKAEEQEREALKIRQQVFGPNSLQTATSLNDLGYEFMAEHKWPEAEKAHSAALDIRKRLLGMENAATATSLNDLAAAYREEGWLVEAHAMADEALKIRQEVLGPVHVDVADSLRNLCIIAGSEEKWDKAEELARETLAMRRKVLPADHPYIADSLEDLAWAESGEGKFKEAKAVEAQVLAMRGTLLDPSNPDIARTVNALGQLLANQGDLPTSDAVLRAVLSIQRKIVGDDNQATIDTFVALSRVLNSENKTNEAESVVRETLVVLNKKGDDASPQKLLIMRSLCDTLEQEGRWQEAEPLWREALPLWRKLRGGEDNESMYTLRRLGLTLEAEHKWPEAEALYREALSISRKKGEHDPEALMDFEKLLRVLMYEKRFSEAQDLLDKMLTPSFISQPSSGNLLGVRVSLNGRRGRWREAKADAAVALKSQPTDHYQYHTLIALLAITDDRPAYDELCHTLAAKFPNPANPYIAERIAQDYLLLPNSGVNLEVIDRLADTSVTLGSGDRSLPYFQACKAMSNYRLGRFGDAITWGEKAAQNDAAEPQAKAKALAVLAMAYWQLGQKVVARARLDTGDALAPVFTPGPDADLGASWIAWIMARISLDEATRLIRAGSTTENTNTQP
jgi:tetratricopeptide (TPR) repeat protein